MFDIVGTSVARNLITLTYIHVPFSCHHIINRSSYYRKEHWFSIHCNSVTKSSPTAYTATYAQASSTKPSPSKYLSCNPPSSMKQGSPACCTMTTHRSDAAAVCDRAVGSMLLHTECTGGTTWKAAEAENCKCNCRAKSMWCHQSGPENPSTWYM
jgi:hypothetical protein